MSRRANYELRVLKSCLLFPEQTLYQVLYTLGEEDFQDRLARNIFKELKKAVDKGNKTSEALSDYLQDKKIDVDRIISSWSGFYNKETISDPIWEIRNRSNLSKLKKIYEMSLEQVEKVDTDSNQHMSSLISQITSLTSINKDKTLEELSGEIEMVREVNKGKELFGISLGLKSVDFFTKGMQQKQLMLVGGATSAGKTWFGIQAARMFCLDSKRVLYLSFEMAAHEIFWRLVVQNMETPDVNLFKIKNQNGLTPEQDEDFKAELELAKSYKLDIVDALMDWEEVKLRLLHFVYVKKVDCVVVDYLQNVVVRNAKSEYESMNVIVRDLQRMAVENNIFVLCLSQLNREIQKSSYGSVFGFKGSGNIENAADIALLIKTDKEDKSHIVLDVAKNRSGLTGKVNCFVDYSRGTIIDEGFANE